MRLSGEVESWLERESRRTKLPKLPKGLPLESLAEEPIRVGRFPGVGEERVYPPVHPGLVIELEWLEPMGVSVYELAKAAGVTKQRMYALVRGERGISADTALRLSRVHDMTPDFWMGLQTDYALEMAEWGEGEKIQKETRSLVSG